MTICSSYWMPCMVNKDFSLSLRAWTHPSPELSLGNIQLSVCLHLLTAFHPMHVYHNFQQRVKETFTHITGDIFLGSTFLSIMLTFGLQLTYPGSSNHKESACNARDLGSIPGYRRYPEEGHGNPLQYTCVENSIDREAWLATVHGLAKSRTQLSN